MQRLTHKDLRKACNDPWDYCGLDSVCNRDCFKPTPCKIPKMIDRLAEYEDTGLEPKQVRALINWFQLNMARMITAFKHAPIEKPKEDKHGTEK